MCGILGFVGPSRPGLRNRFEAALTSIAHRGPTDHGIYENPNLLLGNRRLAIIDLSPLGHQPMRDPESDFVISFNGEIYNYLELRSELVALGHRFESNSDTEVLLKAYRQWGSKCLDKLNGMWAFAIWDSSTQRVFLSRDRFGVKPLYYVQGKDFVAFASEPKAILKLCPEYRTVNERALYRFLSFSELYAENESFYSDVHLMPPGYFAHVDVREPAITPVEYWVLQHQRSSETSLDEALTKFSSIFADSVRIRLRSDVPVGLALSGGVDSSCILAAASESLGAKLTCLTATYGEEQQGELNWARGAAAATTNGIEVVPIDAPKDQWLDTLRTISYYMDAPGYSPAVYPTWKIMEAAQSRGIPVMLEGQGADEIFGGYMQHGAVALMSLLKHGHLYRFLKSSSSLRATFSVTTLIKWMLRETFPGMYLSYRRAFGGESLITRDVLLPYDDDRRRPCAGRLTEKASPLTTRLSSDFSYDILPGLLHYGDAVSMARSVETRLPFMDYRLVEWAFAQDDSKKFVDGRTKGILRAYLQNAGLGVIAARMDKRGYPTPVSDWLADRNGDLAREILLGSGAALHKYCDRRAIERLISRHASAPQSTGNNVYKLVSTELWLQSCIQSSAAP